MFASISLKLIEAAASLAAASIFAWGLFLAASRAAASASSSAFFFFACSSASSSATYFWYSLSAWANYYALRSAIFLFSSAILSPAVTYSIMRPKIPPASICAWWPVIWTDFCSRRCPQTFSFDKRSARTAIILVAFVSLLEW